MSGAKKQFELIMRLDEAHDGDSGRSGAAQGGNQRRAIAVEQVRMTFEVSQPKKD